MKGPPLGAGGEEITWPDQVAPWGQKASSTRKIQPQTSNLVFCIACALHLQCPVLANKINCNEEHWKQFDFEVQDKGKGFLICTQAQAYDSPVI